MSVALAIFDSPPRGSADYSYDALGNLHAKAFTANDGAQRTVSNIYSTVSNRLTASNDTGVKGDRTVEYDLRGNITRLVGADTAHNNLRMIYDKTDQPVMMSGRVDGAGIYHQYMYDGHSGSFAFCKNNKVSKIGQTRSDLRGRINANGQGRVRSRRQNDYTYNVYDMSGKLVHVDIRPTATEPAKSTDYIPGFARITTDGAGIDSVTYMHDDPVCFSQTKSTRLGSASLATDDTGAVSWAESYTPFGETLLNPAANDNQGGFTGHIKDKLTGLNYMQARYYDPNMGRFLSIDPVGFLETGHPGMFNRYAYTFNDPINLADPDGNNPVKVGVRIGKEIARKPAVNALSKAVGGAENANLAYDVITSGGDPFAVAGAVGEKLGGKIADKIGDAVGAAKKLNGNCKSCTKPQHRYEIADQTGDVKKTGISGQPLNQNGTSRRANSQVNQLNNSGDGNTYSATVKETNIPGRAAALDAEKAATNTLSSRGNSLELQQRPRPD